MGLLSVIDSKVVSLDEIYYRVRLKSKEGKLGLFHKGWGNQAALDAIEERWDAPGWAPVPNIRWNAASESSHAFIASGWMDSEVYADALPHESRKVGVMIMRPKKARAGATLGVVLAPTSREAGFRRRWKWADWLAKRGITVLMVDNPFMGMRKPPGQEGGVLSYFADFPITCAASAEECRSAVSWMLANGIQRVCVSGVSQGGYAAIVSSLRSDTERVCAVAVVPPNGADQVIEEGVPGRLCAWDALAEHWGSVDEARARMEPVFQRTRIDRMDLTGLNPKVVVVGAERDKYVPKSSMEIIVNHLGHGCEARWTQGGHVSAILERGVYMREIVKSLESRWEFVE